MRKTALSCRFKAIIIIQTFTLSKNRIFGYILQIVLYIIPQISMPHKSVK
jgi:hypothetical protein